MKNVDDIRKLFESYGYNERETNKIIESYVNEYTDETMKRKVIEIYNYLLNYYSKQKVIKITTSNVFVFSMSLNTIKKNISDMIDLGYEEDEVYKMIGIHPSLIGLTKDNYTSKIDAMKKLGFKKDDVLNMSKKLPQIYGYSIDSINNKFSNMEDLGFTKEEIITMAKSFPHIFGITTNNIKQKIDYISSLDYSREDVFRIIKGLPTLFGLTNENIKGKIDFYDSIGMHDLAFIDPPRLRQSASLSYARYMFYKENGIIVDMDNYYELFINEKRFEQKYKLSKKQLLMEYNYNDYINKKKGSDKL